MDCSIVTSLPESEAIRAIPLEGGENAGERQGKHTRKAVSRRKAVKMQQKHRRKAAEAHAKGSVPPAVERLHLALRRVDVDQHAALRARPCDIHNPRRLGPFCWRAVYIRCDTGGSAGVLQRAGLRMAGRLTWLAATGWLWSAWRWTVKPRQWTVKERQ